MSQLTKPDAASTVANLKACFASFGALIADLDAAAWSTPSYCPDWTTQGIAAHLLGIEKVMTGWMPESGTDLPPFADVGAVMEHAGSLGPADMVALYEEVISARVAELDALTPEQLAGPSGTPVGPGTYAGFLSVRVFDFWVHEQDVRGPLGMPGHQDGPAAAEALHQTLSSLPYIMGKKVGMEDGMSMALTITGGVETEAFVRVDGRAGLVEAVDKPTFTLEADALAFQLLACGRIDPQGCIDAGTISWGGSAEWGERAARNLRYTM